MEKSLGGNKMKMNEKEIKELREFTREMIVGKRNSNMSFEEWSNYNFKEFVKVFEEFVKGLFESLGCELGYRFNYSDLYFSIPSVTLPDCVIGDWRDREGELIEYYLLEDLTEEESEKIRKGFLKNNTTFKNEIDKLLKKGREYCDGFPLHIDIYNNAHQEVKYMANRVYDLIGEFLEENKGRKETFYDITDYVDVFDYTLEIINQIEEELNTLGLGALEYVVWNQDTWADDMEYLRRLGL